MKKLFNVDVFSKSSGQHLTHEELEAWQIDRFKSDIGAVVNDLRIEVTEIKEGSDNELSSDNAKG